MTEFEMALLQTPAGVDEYSDLQYMERYRKTIQLALRIAEKLESGEVSNNCEEKGELELPRDQYGYGFAKRVFKEMAAELIKQCEENGGE